MKERVVIEPKGVCAMEIGFDIEDGVVSNVEFKGGCGGNAAGIARMCEGRRAEDIIKRLKGVICRGNTSCPDQLAQALQNYLTKEL